MGVSGGGGEDGLDWKGRSGGGGVREGMGAAPDRPSSLQYPQH